MTADELNDLRQMESAQRIQQNRGSELIDLVKQSLADSTACYVAGMEAAHTMSPYAQALGLILREYDACNRFENVRIPTRLELAIEAARKISA